MSPISPVTIFLAVCFLPVLLILYITLRNEQKPKNNIILSTTLPKEAWEEERVLAVRKSFIRELNITCLILALLYLPTFFIEYISVQLTYILLWLDAIIIVPYLPYCKNVKKLRALKRENWYHPELIRVQVTDTSLASVFEETQNTYTFVNFLLPLLVSLIPLLYPLVVPVEGSALTPMLIVVSNAVTILLFYGCHHLIRKKADRVNADVTLTAVLIRIRRYYWEKYWLYLGWLCAFFSFSTLLLPFFETAFLYSIGIFTAAVVILTLGIDLTIRSRQQRINKEQPSEILADEDDYWPFGVFYYNRNDTNFLVNNRTGMGTTTNLAHPLGKVIAVLLILLLLALPSTGLFLRAEEFTKTKVLLTEVAIEAHHTGVEYAVPLCDISAVSLLSSLPYTSKNVGTNFPHFYKGDFYVKGISNNCRVCLNPFDSLFLLIRTQSGKYFLFSMEESGELELIYQELLNRHKIPSFEE